MLDQIALDVFQEHRAEIAAQAILDEVTSSFDSNHWEVAYGSSGTIGAVADLLLELGQPLGVISRSGLAQLKERSFFVGQRGPLRVVAVAHGLDEAALEVVQRLGGDDAEIVIPATGSCSPACASR